MQNGNCSLQFSRVDRSAPDTPKSSVLFQLFNPFSGQSDSRLIQTVKKKRKLFPEQRQTSWSSNALPPRICILVQETSPDSLSDNNTTSTREWTCIDLLVFTISLGPTHSRPIAVLEKPFSTSALKIFT